MCENILVEVKPQTLTLTSLTLTRTLNPLQVRIPGMPLVPGTVLTVRVVAADEVDLIAEPVM